MSSFLLLFISHSANINSESHSHYHSIFCFLMRAPAKMCFKSSPFSLILYFSLLSLSNNLSIASDTISQCQSISGNKTIISDAGVFELGFFTPGNSRNYYIGIWYKKISNHTVVWVANRETPVSDPQTSQLKLTKDGNLILYSQFRAESKRRPVWSSNVTLPAQFKSYINAVLLDSGNLVLRDQSNSSLIVWQSFDHLTDNNLPNNCLGMNKVTGEYQRLTPWKNSEDPAPGPFTLTLDPAHGIHQFIYLWNNSKTYWESGAWDGKSFGSLPGMDKYSLFTYNFVDDENRRCFSYNLTNDKILARNTFHSTGEGHFWVWFDDSQGWVLIASAPVSPCDVYSACGSFGICDPKSKTTCSCPTGFSPTSVKDWELGGWSSGCSRQTGLLCDSKNSSFGQQDGFLVMANMRLPVDSQPLAATSAEECEAACLNNCSCTGYVYENGCLIWIGDIRNLRKIGDGDTKPVTLSLRLAASDLPPKQSRGKKSTMIVVISATVGIILALVTISMWIVYKRKQGASRSTEGPLIAFTYSDLQRITKNFSQKLGSGGFGSVFKGVLSDSTTVAVKRLEGVRQGEKQFRNELGTLGTIQHVNLVRLRGFCCEGAERMLIYDYLPNGSLDQYLFPKESEILLEWKTRYQIVLGIARGLAYLHEQCRECIIHCDIKPENVLLDSEYCPKLSDFGMAKLLGHDFSRVLTTMRGTIGYLAPEWIGGLPVTPKVDVYSFGMMVFEVVSGKRNSRVSEHGDISFFPVQAASKVIEGEVASLLDERLDGCNDIIELTRVCRVACWCIHDSEVERPTMPEVVKMLEGVLDVEVPPFPRTLQHLVYEDPITHYHE